MKSRAIQAAVIVAVVGAFLYFTLRSAEAQYGNPDDPYLDYQRQQRERESIELQRRQIQILERQEMFRMLAPPRAHTQEVPIFNNWNQPARQP
jgi:hypothetical protein